MDKKKISLFLSCHSGFPCRLCNLWFATSTTLSRHAMWHHDSFGKYRYSCDLCPYSTNIKCNLERHVFVHKEDRKFVCTVCNNRFNSLTSLNNHMIIHTGEEPRLICPM